jgi:broad specificity phosphatase PhoE
LKKKESCNICEKERKKSTLENPINDSNLILIRHAFALKNFAKKHVDLELTEIMKEFHEVNDCVLHNIGVDQAILSTETLKDINFHTVFVSPQYRALETCFYLLRGHPNIKNIKIIVLP